MATPVGLRPCRQLPIFISEPSLWSTTTCHRAPNSQNSPPPDKLKINGGNAPAALDLPPTSGDFGELIHWCDSFSDTLHDIIDQLHDDMMQISPPTGAIGTEAPAEQQSCNDWRQITDVVDQIHDIVAQLERVAKRATPLIYRA